MLASGVTHGLLHLDLVDLDAEQLVGEVRVEAELVAVLHVAALGRLGHHARLAARQRL